MKIVHIEEENLQILLVAREISMKFSWKMQLTILKVTKKQGHFFEKYVFGKTTGRGGRGGLKMNPSPTAF